MITRKQLIEVAESFVGTSTGDAKHREIISIYNRKTPLPRGYKMSLADPWCAAFVSACGILIGGSDIILRECSCQQMINLYRKEGRFFRPSADQCAAPGDLIFYDWQKDGQSDHVGIVTSNRGYVYEVIEGNKSGRVAQRHIAISSPMIYGYAVPAYDLQKKDLTAVALETIRGRYGNGDRRVQLLTAAGYDPAAVQKEVNRILKLM